MKKWFVDLGAREISPLGLAPLGLLVVVLSLWVPVRLSIQDTESAAATVSDKYVRHTEDAMFAVVSYMFLVDGRQFTGSSEVRDGTYEHTDVGESLVVRYVRGDPSVNRYVADYLVTGREAVVGGMWMLLLAGLPVAWWRQRTRKRLSGNVR